MNSAVLTKPKALKKGDRVGLIAPGWRPYKPSVVSRAEKLVEEMGLVPVVGNHVLEIHGHSAGTVEQRAEDVNRFIADDSVAAIFCISGGFGSLSLLPHLDLKRLEKNPKVFLGGGENTALILGLQSCLGLVTFHGPNLEDVKSEKVFVSLASALTRKDPLASISPATNSGVWSRHHCHVSVQGQRQGRLLGGNLTGLASLFGTAFEPQLKNSILFLTDHDDRNDILGRWFTTLNVSGQLSEIAAMLVGIFDNCGNKGSMNLLSLEDMFGETLTELGIPSIFDFPIAGGECPTVPLGIEVSFDTSTQKLEFLDSAVV